jgi:hypothetical protein
VGVAHVGLCRAHAGTVHCRRGRARGCVEPLWADVLAEHTRVRHTMMMSFICSCRNKKEEQSSIYTLRKVRTIRGCLEGLTLMI